MGFGNRIDRLKFTIWTRKYRCLKTLKCWSMIRQRFGIYYHSKSVVDLV